MINPQQITKFDRTKAELEEFLLFCICVQEWLRMQGVDAPNDTPQGKKYAEFEKIFLQFVRHSGQSVAEFDLNIWKALSNGF